MRTKEAIEAVERLQEIEVPSTIYRPASFEEIVGQTDVVRRLRTLVERAKLSQTVLGHVLFVGPDGCGKEMMAHMVAKGLGVNLKSTAGLDIERAGDLAAIVADLDQGDVLFIDRMDLLRKELIAVLAPAMKTFELAIIVGKGPGARSMRLAVKPFTLVGSVEKESDCPRLLANSFHGRFSFQRYRTEEIQQIAEQSAKGSGLAIEPPVASLVARLADGSPARADSLLQRLRGIEKGPVSEKDAQELFALLGIIGTSTEASNDIVSDWTTLSGIEFERAMTALLVKMGFVAEMTKATGDGGIDIEAYLDKPIIGGRYLIQCKRFAPEALIGSPTIREFYGAVVADRKALKGILITTSGFTAQARDFATNLPIELIDCRQLQNLLKEWP